VLIFKAGVAIHSIIIGVDIGVASGTTFSTLLVAVCFHQCFEGIAVGMSALSAFGNNWRHTLTAILGFVISTPMGVAIGIGISASYSPTSLSSLWVQGILDAVAAGILIYTGLVELLTNQITHNADFHVKSGGIRGLTYSFVALGACAMAIVGIWA
jgi:zinc transporter 1/2/3